MEYHDYFPIHHEPDKVSMDEFIAESMRTDLRFKNIADEFSYLRTSRITLKNEILTCYEFLKKKGLLQEYHQYRDGE